MEKYLLISISVFILNACGNSEKKVPMPAVSSGKIVRLENFFSKFISPHHVDIWLPEGYSGEQKYAVLYMHDGQMLFDSATTWNGQEWGVDEILSQLIKEKKIKPTIVVGVWNAGKARHAEYFPQKPFESLPIAYRDSLVEQAKRDEQSLLFVNNIHSDNYLKFITQELKPYIDRHYSTHSNKDNTYMAGSSMGGLISMYAICEYPHIFGGVACISTHWLGIFSDKNNPIPATFITYLHKQLPEPATHKIYFDYGTETLDAMYEPFQAQADSAMKNRGYNASSWKTIKFVGADHSELSWKKRLHIPVTFLLSSELPKN